MPTPISELFQSEHDIGSPQWNGAVFRRAYLYSGSPFERVVYRVRSGFSVLVYLPGNVMRAAAEVLSAQMRPVAWVEYGLAESKSLVGSKTVTYADIWRASTSTLSHLVNWLKGEDRSWPHAIFHNLDTLNDGHGGLDASNEARTALFYLTECSRSGVVLGLSDLAAGPLPEAVRRPFGEEVWLDEIPTARFPLLIPHQLGVGLAGGSGVLPDGPAYLLASRLRWTDPCRVVRILSDIAIVRDIGDALKQVTAHTRSVEFSDPANLRFDLPGGRSTPLGYEESTTKTIEKCVVDPYRRWSEYTGNEPEVELQKLPPGLILYGPPGTGKSRLARWMAFRIGIPYRQVSAADLKRADWGLTERLVRELFRSARRAAPCMIVLDDADDLLPDRSDLKGGLAGAERGVVNAFLQELEGFHGRMEGVLVVLTTNRRSRLDKAARSRLSLRFRVPYPLNRDQIREIVLELGRSHGILPDQWRPDILTRLENRFFKSMRPVNEDIEEPEVRRFMNQDLFSPREISAALRMMLAAGGVPGDADVDRVEEYYVGLSKESETEQE